MPHYGCIKSHEVCLKARELVGVRRRGGQDFVGTLPAAARSQSSSAAASSKSGNLTGIRFDVPGTELSLPPLCQASNLVRNAKRAPRPQLSAVVERNTDSASSPKPCCGAHAPPPSTPSAPPHRAFHFVSSRPSPPLPSRLSTAARSTPRVALSSLIFFFSASLTGTR